MILFIDTTDFAHLTYAVLGSEVFKKEYTSDPHESHGVLASFEDFLKSSKVNVKDIKKIIACKGPGSYTGTRIGVTHAQALGFAWGIPVQFISKGKIPLDLQNFVPLKKRR